MKFPATLVKTCLFTALTVCLISTNITHAAKSGYYKWTDDNGKVQFTQTPPAGRSSVFVATATGKQSKSPEEEPAPKAGEKAADGKLDGKMEVLPEKDPAKCSQAQANLNNLKSRARIRLTSPDGTQRFLSDEERNAQIKLAEDNIAVHCGK